METQQAFRMPQVVLHVSRDGIAPTQDCHFRTECAQKDIGAEVVQQRLIQLERHTVSFALGDTIAQLELQILSHVQKAFIQTELKHLK